FTDGNLIILYAIYRGVSMDGGLPDYINERVNVCINTFRIIMQSKPDNYKTMIIVVANTISAENIKDKLIKAGIDRKIIAVDCISENVAQTFDHILNIIKTKINPPFIYFVSSVWLRDICESTAISKLKGYSVQFEGALDHRPVEEVEKEKALDIPKKGIEHYKRKAKDKTIDMLLNYIFSEDK
ncbi:MAG: hypothetical protein ACJ702_08780, partial [Nitrososphaeraceae archaeon]